MCSKVEVLVTCFLKSISRMKFNKDNTRYTKENKNKLFTLSDSPIILLIINIY